MAQKIHARRRTLRLTQDELADLAGVSTRFVHELEHAKATVRLDKVLAILHVLGLELSVTDLRVPDATVYRPRTDETA